MTGGVRSMTMADARKFMSSSSEILLSDFAVLADARRRPVFPVFRSAPSHMIAAIHRAYDKRRERRKILDPAYDRSLLQKVESLLVQESTLRMLVQSQGSSTYSSAASLSTKTLPAEPPAPGPGDHRAPSPTPSALRSDPSQISIAASAASAVAKPGGGRATMLVKRDSDGRASIAGPGGRRVVLKPREAKAGAEARGPEAAPPPRARDPNRRTMRSTAVNVVPPAAMADVARRATMRSTAVNIAPVDLAARPPPGSK